MIKFKSMKISITPEQPLDEVVSELERLGFSKAMFTPNKNTKFIVTNESNKLTDIGGFDQGFYTNKRLITLDELKEMQL